jgi:hypothetical protein
MALVPPTLETALTAAYAAALTDFIAVIKANPLGLDSGAANLTAAVTSSSVVFAKLATPAIDAYIRSQTITIPPGQAVATAGSPAAQAGATTAPSPPAVIV